MQDASLSVSNTEGAALVDNVTQRLHDVLGHVLVHGADSLADLLFHLTHAILLPFLHIFDGLLSEALHCCSRCCSALRDLILQKCRSVLMHLVELFHALLLIVNDPPLNILKALLCRFQVVLVQQVKIAASTKVAILFVYPGILASVALMATPLYNNVWPHLPTKSLQKVCSS